MNLPRPTNISIKKPQVNADASDKRSTKVKLALITSNERDKYRVPVYDYIL